MKIEKIKISVIAGEKIDLINKTYSLFKRGHKLDVSVIPYIMDEKEQSYTNEFDPKRISLTVTISKEFESYTLLVDLQYYSSIIEKDIVINNIEDIPIDTTFTLNSVLEYINDVDGIRLYKFYNVVDSLLNFNSNIRMQKLNSIKPDHILTDTTLNFTGIIRHLYNGMKINKKLNFSYGWLNAIKTTIKYANELSSISYDFETALFSASKEFNIDNSLLENIIDIPFMSYSSEYIKNLPFKLECENIIIENRFASKNTLKLNTIHINDIAQEIVYNLALNNVKETHYIISMREDFSLITELKYAIDIKGTKTVFIDNGDNVFNAFHLLNKSFIGISELEIKTVINEYIDLTIRDLKGNEHYFRIDLWYDSLLSPMLVNDCVHEDIKNNIFSLLEPHI